MVAMLMVQMSIMQIIHMVVMNNGSMSTVFTVNVVVVGVNGASHDMFLR